MARLLMIVSSARSIDLASDKEHPTGYFADEVLKPYDKFTAVGVEVAFATPDGATPQADPYGLKPWFHYSDEDKDFLSQVTRSFAPDLDDIRITLHHLTELDLVAARKVFHALVGSPPIYRGGLDGDAAWVSYVIVDRNLLTGQNPDSSEAIAEAIMKRLGVAVK